MTTVTALVSAYFCEGFLRERMENLCRLDPVPEVMVVCRKDSPEHEIAAEYDCRLIVTPDVPTWGAALNLAIKKATGDYLTTANSDDLFYPQGLNVLRDYLDAHDEIGIVHGDVDIRDSAGVRAWKRPGIESIGLRFNRVGPMPLYRARLHKDFGLFDEPMIVSTDYEFWLRCYAYGVKVAHIDETVGMYWKRTDNIGNRHRLAWTAEDAEIRRRYAARLQPQ